MLQEDMYNWNQVAYPTPMASLCDSANSQWTSRSKPLSSEFSLPFLDSQNGEFLANRVVALRTIPTAAALGTAVPRIPSVTQPCEDAEIVDEDDSGSMGEVDRHEVCVGTGSGSATLYVTNANVASGWYLPHPDCCDTGSETPTEHAAHTHLIDGAAGGCCGQHGEAMPRPHVGRQRQTAALWDVSEDPMGHSKHCTI